MTLYVFYFLAFLAVMSALMVVFSRNPIYSVLYLVITFFTVSGNYVLLGAEFLAVVNIIVYAGAIMVLFLYVIMLLNLNNDSEPHKSNLLRFAAVISSGLLLVVFVGALRGADAQRIKLGAGEMGYVKNLGQVLFNEFLLPFEVASILLLAAMVGAVMLGKGHRKRIEGKGVTTGAKSAQPESKLQELV